MSSDRLEVALGSIARELAYPATPTLESTVVARLAADRRSRAPHCGAVAGS